MRESNEIFDDPEALRKRLNEDGFLFLRGFHDRNEVLSVRRDILQIMATTGELDPDAPLMEGVINPALKTQATVSTKGRENLKTDSLKRLLYGPRPTNFFRKLFAAEPMAYQFQWLRAGGHGAGSTISILRTPISRRVAPCRQASMRRPIAFSSSTSCELCQKKRYGLIVVPRIATSIAHPSWPFGTDGTKVS